MGSNPTLSAAWGTRLKRNPKEKTYRKIFIGKYFKKNKRQKPTRNFKQLAKYHHNRNLDWDWTEKFSPIKDRTAKEAFWNYGDIRVRPFYGSVEKKDFESFYLRLLKKYSANIRYKLVPFLRLPFQEHESMYQNKILYRKQKRKIDYSKLVIVHSVYNYKNLIDQDCQITKVLIATSLGWEVFRFYGKMLERISKEDLLFHYSLDQVPYSPIELPTAKFFDIEDLDYRVRFYLFSEINKINKSKEKDDKIISKNI